MNDLTIYLQLGYGVGYREGCHNLLIALWPLEEHKFVFQDIWKVILDNDLPL